VRGLGITGEHLSAYSCAHVNYAAYFHAAIHTQSESSTRACAGGAELVPELGKRPGREHDGALSGEDRCRHDDLHPLGVDSVAGVELQAILSASCRSTSVRASNTAVVFLLSHCECPDLTVAATPVPEVQAAISPGQYGEITQ
jgi:hypothetical protein